MKVNQAYYVVYLMHEGGEAKGLAVLASSKDEARIKATYEAIPAQEGKLPYWVFVESVTYQNGNCRIFNK